MFVDHAAIAGRLIAAYDGVNTLAPITSGAPHFTIADGYLVLDLIEARRRAQGWQLAGRKIGFTNRNIWARYNVAEPLWAHLWTHTVKFAARGRASLDLTSFVNPRIEPEVVFKLKGPVPLTDDPAVLLGAVEWMAPGFEIVQSHFPNWTFRAPDCAAAFGLHGALIVGAQVAVTADNRARLAALLPRFALTLSRGDKIIERGVGANVLDSPALALGYLARVLAGQPQFLPLSPGEIVTTGTITDAWPVVNGETWSSDYGELGLDRLTLSFAEPR